MKINWHKLIPMRWRMFLLFDLPSKIYRWRWKKVIGVACSFEPTQSFEEIHKKWFYVFKRTLKLFGKRFSNKSINDLFYNWCMCNWKAMWQERSEYDGMTKEQLKEHFCYEVFYCSDRMSYDRLFRCHWLFRHAFYDELNKLEE